jgi:hypothetical protein
MLKLNKILQVLVIILFLSLLILLYNYLYNNPQIIQEQNRLKEEFKTLPQVPDSTLLEFNSGRKISFADACGYFNADGQ